MSWFPTTQTETWFVFEILTGPAEMIVTPFIPGERQSLKWNRASIIPGRHLIGIRANDQAGGVVDRYQYIDFSDIGLVQLESLQQADPWRESISQTVSITVSSEVPLSSFSGFQLDSNSRAQGMMLDFVAPIGTNHGGYWTYTLPLSWTPKFAGTYDVELSARNDNGPSKIKMQVRGLSACKPGGQRPAGDSASVLGPFSHQQRGLFPTGNP